MSSEQTRRVIGGALFFWLATSSAQSQEAPKAATTPTPELKLERRLPGTPDQDKAHAETILKEQLRTLHKQGFLGKGASAKRRLKVILENAEKAFKAQKYEDASLNYYRALENPEFTDYIDAPEIEYQLILSLQKATEDYVALDYLLQALRRGPKAKHFNESFRIMVDILNQDRLWSYIGPIMDELHKQFANLPPEIREESSYLFGRYAFFQRNFDDAKKIFKSINTSSRFAYKAQYHLGVIAVEQGELSQAIDHFDKASTSTETDVRNIALLARARVQYTLKREANFLVLEPSSNLYPQALYENGWNEFQKTNYAQSKLIAAQFLQKYPEHELVPKVFMLQAQAQMENGELEEATRAFQKQTMRYESLVGQLRLMADSTDAQAFYDSLKALGAKTAYPEVLAWILQEKSLEEIREALSMISQEENSLKGSENAWADIKKTIVSENRQVFFPGATRIKRFGGREVKSPYRTKTGEKLFEVERLETEMSARLQEMDRALESYKPTKGRTYPVKKALEDERDRLKAVHEKLAGVRQKLLEEESKLPPKPPEKEEYKGGAKEFKDLIDREVALIPQIRESLGVQRGAFENLTLRITQERMRDVADGLSNLVLKSYLGQIEVAFIKRQKTGGKDVAAREQLIGLINGFVAKYPESEEIPFQLFRLAELAYDQSKDDFFVKQEAYEKEYDKFTKGSLKTEPTEPKPDYSESVKLCQRILKEYPKFKRRDQVLYLLGYYLEEQGDHKASVAMFQTLIEEFPDSDFVIEGYMRTAENYFVQGNYAKANQTYKIILRYPESVFYELALYKIAWTNFKQRNYQTSVEYFSKLVDFSEKKLVQNKAGTVQGESPEGKEARKRLADLRDEAMTYLALCFTEMGGAPEVVAQFKRLGMEQHTQKILKRLTDIYYDQQRYNETISSAKTYLEIAPYDPDGPEYQNRIIEAYDKLGEDDAAFQERQRLAVLFGPRSAWNEHNRDNPEAIKRANDVVEGALVYSATFYHERAQKEASKGKDSYGMALEAYRKYIWEFPDSPRTYEMRFNYAEALYAVGNYEAAAYHYKKVAEADPNGKYLKDAALNAIFCYEKVLAKSGTVIQPKPGEKVKLDTLEKMAKTKPTPRALSNNEKELLEAYDHYVQWLPKAEKAPEISFKSGMLLYEAKDYAGAQQRFQTFYEKYPTSPLRASAINYLINSSMAQQDWPGVERWSRLALNDPSMAKNFDQKSLKNLVAASMLYKAQTLEKSGQLEKASEQYLAIDKEFQDPKIGAAGVYNAAVNYEKAGKSAQAVAMLERLVQRYPNSDLAPKSLFQVAKAYEHDLDYGKAASAYERLARTYPRSESAADAVYNAGLFYEAQGESKRAVQNYLAYVQQNPSRSDVREVHLQAAKLAERSGETKLAGDLYVEHAARFAKDIGTQAEAYGRAGVAYQKAGLAQPAATNLKRSLELYRKNPRAMTPEGLHYAALARFEEGEQAFRHFQSVKLQLPQKRMLSLLEQKAKLLQESNKIYTDVVAIGDAEMATAGLYRIGKSYHQFSEALFQAPKPKNLDAKALEIYEQQLQDQAVPLEDKAIEAYERGLNKAYELKAYGPWTEKIYAELAKLRPQKFSPVVERMPPRLKGRARSERGFVRFSP